MFSYLFLVIVFLSINLYDGGLLCPYKQIKGQTETKCGCNTWTVIDSITNGCQCQSKCGK